MSDTTTETKDSTPLQIISTLSDRANKQKEKKSQSNQLAPDADKIIPLICDSLEPIDFREIWNIENGKPVQEKLYKISIVEHLLEAAKNLGYQFCNCNGMTYVYNGACWKSLDSVNIKKLLDTAVNKSGTPDDKAKDSNFQKKVKEQFEATIPAKKRSGTKSALINLLNGTLSIDGSGNNILNKHNPDDFLTYQLSFNYDPDAQAPIFNTYMNRVLPDVTAQQVLSEYMGYVFIPNSVLKLEKTVLLSGEGSNGKGVFYEIISGLLGTENISSYTIGALCAKNTTRAQIMDKLLNYDSDWNGKLTGDIFKKLVSGEDVDAKYLFKDEFIMSNYARLMFNGNVVLKDAEHTHGFWRRWIIIPFAETITEQEKDPNLHTKIKESELAGVFNWVLDGMQRLLKQKTFTECKTIVNALKDLRRSVDTVSEYMEVNGYEPHESGFVLLKHLFTEFKQYCTECGYKNQDVPQGLNTFKKRLAAIGFKQREPNVSAGVAILCTQPL